AEKLYSLSAAVTKNTYTTIAAFSGVAGTNTVMSIPAGLFLNNNPAPVGRKLLVVAAGTIGVTATPTFAGAININPTVATTTNNIAMFAATTLSAASATFQMEAWIMCTAFATSTMTLQINGRWEQEVGAAGAALAATGLYGGFQATWTGRDPRVTQYVELFGTWSASSASNTTTLQQFDLYGMDGPPPLRGGAHGSAGHRHPIRPRCPGWDAAAGCGAHPGGCR